MNQDIQTIAFQGNQIMTAQQGEVNYVAMKSVCESIGLNWRSQYNRIKRHAFLNSTVVMMTTVAEDGKEREMLMLPLNYFQGWLFTVDSNRVKLEIRDRLIAYQKECFDVLHDYWQNKSVQPETEDTSTAACFSEFHVFLEVTRGRMQISPKGTPHNSVSMVTALVLQYLYYLPDENELRVSARELGRELKIDNRSVCHAIDRMGRWCFLIKKSSPGEKLRIYLDRKKIDQDLSASRNNLLTHQQKFGYLQAL